MIKHRFTKKEFELAFRKFQEDHGHKYDQWDINQNWKAYNLDPKKYDWLPTTMYKIEEVLKSEFN